MAQTISIGEPWLWWSFAAFVIIALVIDLVSLKQSPSGKVSVKQALSWSLVWITLAFVFNGLLWWYLQGRYGETVATAKSIEFFTGYLIEKSLSVDNIFVFLMIFNYFAIPVALQKRVLVMGIIGALILRAIMIVIGAWLISQFHWVMYVFGAFLLITGVKMALGGDQQVDYNKNPLMKWLKRKFKVTDQLEGERFFVLKQGIRYATPLVLVIALIGVTDVVFAVDSIPAIFAITTDPFIVLTSNVFAILGLRALYFLLADMAERFHLLSYGLALILIFIGIKMLLIDVYKIPIAIALSVVVGILVSTIWLSSKIPPKRK
jgi:tellurite resistance protein TerC